MPRGNPKPSAGWKPGQSGNPGGKPVASRNTLNANFLKVLSADFDQNGKEAIEQARITDPMGYVRAIASLLPKEFVIERPMDGMSDDELAATLGVLRERLASLEAARDGMVAQTIREQASELPTVQ